MNDFLLAETLYKRSKFKECYQHFMAIVKKESASNEDKIRSCQKILSLLEIIHIVPPLEDVLLLATTLEESRDLEEAEQLYWKLFKRFKEERLFSKSLDLLIKLGEVEKARVRLHEYLSVCLDRRYFLKGLSILNLYSNLLNQKNYYFYELSLHLISGDLQKIKSLLENFLKNESKKVAIREEVIFKLITQYASELPRTGDMIALYLSFLSKTDILSKERNVEERKFILKQILDGLEFEKSKENALLMSIYYSRLNQIKNIGLYSSKILEREDLINKFSTYEEDREINLDSFDSLEDLTKIEINEIEKIERDINFLKRSGETKRLSSLMDRLKVIDPENKLLNNEEKRKVLMDSSQLTNSLIKEIQKYTDSKKQGDDIADKKALGMAISKLNKEFIQSFFPDLVYSLTGLGFFDLAISLLKNIDIGKFTNTEKVNHQYLLIESLIKNGNIYEALELLDVVLDESPLTKNEKANFIYMKSEILLNQGHLILAKEGLVYLNHFYPGFRLTKQKLEEIERNK